jgi:hypothetical protein
MTESEAQKQLDIIGEALGLKRVDRGERLGYCASFHVSQDVELFVRLMGAGGRKGYASIDPSFKHKGSEGPYFSLRQSSERIHFAEGKDPMKIAADIKRRLLAPAILDPVATYIVEVVKHHEAYKARTHQLADQVRAAGAEVDEKGKVYYNRGETYFSGSISGDSLYLERFSAKGDEAAKIIAAIIKINEEA